jgi:hypothetical protein
MGKSSVALVACCSVVAWAGSSEATLCFKDAKGDGTGLPMRWATMPVQYYINASKLPPGSQTAAIDAVQAAFTAYKLPTCATLEFHYAGPSTSVASQSGAVLVVFSDVSTGSAYYYEAAVQTYDPPDIVSGLIQMTINPYNYVVGKQPNAIDIQTAVMQMIPGVIGFYAAAGDPAQGNLPEINFDHVNHTLSQDQKDGILVTYPTTDAGCTKPAAPPACQKSTPAGDGVKPAGDGVKPAGDGKPVTSDGYKPPLGDAKSPGVDGGVHGDATLPPPPAESGCCRVSHATSDLSGLYLGVVGVIVLVLLRRRRR